MPDCAAWVASGCRAALAGRNPAFYSSIVDVRSLADGSTERYFEAAPSNPVGVKAGGLMIEFWGHDCRRAATLGWWDGVDCRRTGLNSECAAEFTIQRGTRWMTVTSNGNAHMRWTLS
jgi:hypothetical protein